MPRTAPGQRQAGEGYESLASYPQARKTHGVTYPTGSGQSHPPGLPCSHTFLGSPAWARCPMSCWSPLNGSWRQALLLGKLT